jgi:hypothetical protein
VGADIPICGVDTACSPIRGAGLALGRVAVNPSLPTNCVRGYCCNNVLEVGVSNLGTVAVPGATPVSAMCGRYGVVQ